MSLPLRLSLLLLLILSCPAMAADSDEGNIEPSTPLRPESRAPVQWDVARAASADVTCEGKEDTIVLGYQGKNQVWISVRRNGTEGRPLLPPIILPVGTEQADAFCRLPLQIQTFPLDCKKGDGPLEGCVVKPGCQGFTLSDGACDGIHFYWNSQKQRLDWWRR